MVSPMPEAVRKRQCVDLGASPDVTLPNKAGHQPKVRIITQGDVVTYSASNKTWLFLLNSLPVAPEKNLLVSVLHCTIARLSMCICPSLSTVLVPLPVQRQPPPPPPGSSSSVSDLSSHNAPCIHTYHMYCLLSRISAMVTPYVLHCTRLHTH